MEEQKNASVTINLKEGHIIISGSEEFVEKNMKEVFSFVERTIHLPTDGGILSETKIETKEEIKVEREEARSGNAVDKYIAAGVYHIDSEGEISILKRIPGNSKSEKTKNIALIVLYIRNGKIQGKDIIPLCEKHACYDSANFSSVFKNEKTNIVRKGNGQSWTLELTQPGEEAAISLLEEMANDKK